MRDLLALRDEIDQVDREITALYQKRVQLTSEVAAYKIRTGKKVFDQKREQEKLEKLASLVPEEFGKTEIRELFGHIMALSRKRQYRLLGANGIRADHGFTEVEELAAGRGRIVFQGAEGAYAHIAMHQYFGSASDRNSFHVESWREAMEAIQNGEADFAVLPIENSTAGVVAENYDLLVEYDNAIIGEQIIPVRHCLLGLPQAELSDITDVCSHPQALAQCDAFLQAHGQWECRKESNTAVAAQSVRNAGCKNRAAIASELTARLYGLKILAQDIQTNSENSTRFIIVAKKKIFLKNASKISICLPTKHQSGSLYHALSHIIYNNLNMNFIQSRPLQAHEGANWQYRFFIDFEGNLNESAVQNALSGLMEEYEDVRVLGNY